MPSMSATCRAPRRTPVGATRPARPATVDVLICGSAGQGDDAAPLAVADLLRGTLPAEVRVRRVGLLEVDHLLAIRRGAGVVIVDAATGVACGSIHELPLRGALVAPATVRPRSSHALELPEVIGVADMVRGRPLVGAIVVVGGRQFGRGRPLSASVTRALPALARAVRAAVERIGQSLLPVEDAPLEPRSRLDPASRPCRLVTHGPRRTEGVGIRSAP